MGDRFGGVTEQTSGRKNRVAEELHPVASQGRPTLAEDSNAHSNVDSHRASHMETTNFVEDFMQNLSPSLSPIIRVINSIQNSTPSDNCPQDFENQIEEIDSALNKFDSYSISTTDMPSVTPTHSQPGEINSKISTDFLGVEAQSNPPPPSHDQSSYPT